MVVKRAVSAKFILKLSPMKMTDRKAYSSRANCRPSRGRPVSSRAGNCPVAYISPKKVYDRKKDPYCKDTAAVSVAVRTRQEQHISAVKILHHTMTTP